MSRAQIHIPQALHEQLHQIARKRREPMDRVVCNILKVGVEKMQSEEAAGIQVLKNIANLKLKGGPRDLSARLDHYLYGEPTETK